MLTLRGRRPPNPSWSAKADHPRFPRGIKDLDGAPSRTMTEEAANGGSIDKRVALTYGLCPHAKVHLKIGDPFLDALTQ